MSKKKYNGIRTRRLSLGLGLAALASRCGIMRESPQKMEQGALACMRLGTALKLYPALEYKSLDEFVNDSIEH